MRSKAQNQISWIVFPAGFALLVAATGLCPAESTAEHTARLDTEKLHLVVAHNEAYGPHHRAGYNDETELRLGPGDQKNLFVPNYAGLNLEHVFSGDAESFGWNIFEPRRFPMELIRHATNRVELRHGCGSNLIVRPNFGRRG